MIIWWHYLLLVNFYLILFFVFYKVFLRQETFFQLNRVYLVAASLISFLIPLIQLEWVHQLFITQRVQQTIYATINPGFIYHVKPVENTPMTLGEILSFVYLTGAIILLARFVFQLLKLKTQLKVEITQTPFSFFNTLRVNDNLPGRDTVIAHEEVHVTQWHSADVLLIEAIMIINWFNPVVYLYRKAIKYVHEFIADRKVIQTGILKEEYALLLLSQTFGISPHQLTNTFFNQSLLKQRIKMLNQDESRRRGLLKYGLSAPLFVAMLIFSSATIKNSALIRIINKKTDQAFAITTVHLNNTPSKATEKNKLASPERKIVVKNSQENNLNEVKLTTTSKIMASVIDSSTMNEASPVFSAVEINPTFPGGEVNLYRFLSANIHYPDKAKATNISGRVFIQFVVEKDGSLSNFKILRDPGAGLGAETERVLATSPKWSPGIQNGNQVRVQYTVPVNFSLENNNSADTIKVKTINISKKQIYFFSTPVSDTVKQLTTNNIATNKIAFDLKKWPLLGNTLILLDGKEIAKERFSKIDAKSIAVINVFKDDATKFYGERGKNGVVSIVTKPAEK